MQITKTTLRRIIKEELDAVLNESMQKMLGLPHQYTTQDLMRAVQGLIDSPQGDMTPGSSEARDVETLISNHIRDKGTPEEKDALKKLRDDFLKSIGSVYRGGVSSAHAGQTRYEKSRQRRAHFRDAMNEDEDAEDAAEDAAYDKLSICVKAVMKDLMAAGINADYAENMIQDAVRTAVLLAR
jgi:hypothetical protein